MEDIKKDGSILKKLGRFLSQPKSPKKRIFRKSKSWHSTSRTCAPNGCFSVCVGEEKRRFVIKIEYANHPLFRMLLEDSEMEYGFKSEGPILIPCEVDLFVKLLCQMDRVDDEEEEEEDKYVASGFCTPLRRRSGKGDHHGCSSYGLLTPPRLLKINHF